MAKLEGPDAAIVVLHTQHLVGRASVVHTRLSDPQVSAQHAVVMWTGQSWLVRDLGSRNGTWLDGERLPVQIAEPLRRGAVLWFGDARNAYTFIDDAPPAPQARSGDRVIEGDDGLLALPDASDPDLVATYEPEAGWMIEDEAGCRPIADGATVDLDGTTWTLVLPEPIAQTTDAPRPLLAGDCQLRFAVSRDEEYVQVTFGARGASVPLKPRAHHYAMLVLARARLADRGRGIPPAEEGWMVTADLLKELQATRNQLYVMLHRCRKDVRALGVLDPLFERRATAQQMRLSITDVAVQRGE